MIADVVRDLLGPSDLARAEAVAREREIPLADAVVALGLASEDQVHLLLADRLGLPYVFPNGACVDAELVARFPHELLSRHGALPLVGDGAEVVVAFAAPPSEEAVAELAAHAGAPVRPALASRRRIEQALERTAGAGRMPPRRAAELDLSGVTAFYRHLAAACADECSELRFEPGPDGVRVRARGPDGLVERAVEPATLAVGIAARARLLASSRDVPFVRAEIPATVAGKSLHVEVVVAPAAAGDVVALRFEPAHELPRDLAGWGVDADALCVRLRACRVLDVRSESRPARRAFARALAATAFPPSGSVLVAVEAWRAPPLEGFVHVADPAAAIALRPDLVLADGVDVPGAPRVLRCGELAAGPGVRVFPHGKAVVD